MKDNGKKLILHKERQKEPSSKLENEFEIMCF